MNCVSYVKSPGQFYARQFFYIKVHLYKSEVERESDVTWKLLHCSRLCVYTKAMFERQKIKEKIAFAFALI